MTKTVSLTVQARGRTWNASVAIDESLTLVELCELLPGHRPRHSCMVGACGTCRLRIEQGAHLLDANAFGEDYSGRAIPGTVLACLAGLRKSTALETEMAIVLVAENEESAAM